MTRVLPIAVLLALVAIACSPFRDNEAVPADEGDLCSRDFQCGSGLVCGAAGACAPVGEPGTAALDEPCSGDDGCRFGLVCNALGRCGDTRRGETGEACRDDAGCGPGLVCAQGPGNIGSCQADGQPGTTAEGEACSARADCRFGLTCTGDDVCGPLPRWSGVECAEPALAGPARVLFEVPRGQRDADFFRLPYPNDALVQGGVVDRSGFPGLENAPAPAELVGRMVSALGETRNTGLNPAVVFRFSRNIDFSTLDFGGEAPTFSFVDITPGLEEGRGRRPRSRFFATTDRSRYICNNWLAIRPSEGSPLMPEHTYAVFFRRGILDDDGEPLEVDADFAAVMSETPPAHPALQHAWQQYAPFRDWLLEEGIPLEDVIGGTVFSTGTRRDQTAQLRAAVQAAPVPALDALTICDGGTDSPCEGGGERTCGDLNEFYTEVHGLATLPDFLRGVPPYDDWGGDFDDHVGPPRLQRQAPVCVAATVPRGQAPAGGWPVVVFAHEAGGHFRSFVLNGLAQRLARLGWATVSFDGVLHGTRYAPDGQAPSAQAVMAVLDDLERPRVMRDTSLQWTADLFSMVRLLTDARIPTDDGNQRLSRQHVAFFGHGRGARVGMPFLAYEPGVRAAVLASAGGSMVDVLADTRQPANLRAELEVALAEPDLSGMHPAMHLLQSWLDAVDPQNFGALMRTPPEGVGGKHLFQIYGLDDTWSSKQAQNHLATSLRVTRIGDELEELEAVPAAETAVVQGNARVADGSFTQVIKQYAPEGSADGHDVAFESREAIGDLNTFFTGLLEDPAGPALQ